MKKQMEKSILVLDLFQPNLANLQPLTALISTTGNPIWWTKDNIYC